MKNLKNIINNNKLKKKILFDFNNENKEKIKKIKLKMFKEIENDKKIVSDIQKLFNIKTLRHELVYNNIAIIYDYKHDLDYCDKCPGLEKCKKQPPNYIKTLIWNGEYLYQQLIPCKLKKIFISKDENYIIRDFPYSWCESKIENLDRSSTRLKLIKRYNEIIENKNKKWIYIVGSYRSGKSFVVATLLNNFIQRTKQKTIFLNCPKRIKYLYSLSYNNKEEFNELFNLYSNIKLLVLDDFGDEYKNEYIRDNIIIPLLIKRAKNNLITIFTSHFNYDGLAEMYSIKTNSKIRGEQLKNILKDFAGDYINISTTKIY